MFRSNIRLAAIACCLAFGSAHALTAAEYKAEKARIDADYKVARAKCDTLAGNRKDVCVKEAEAAKEKAEAAAKANYKGSAKAYRKMMEESAEADYKVAKEK